jgi:hypothetical protein
MYVPIIELSIQPVKNDEKAGIEGTHRPVRCPPYMKALFKAKWGPRAKIVEVPITDADHVDRIWKVPQLPGKDAVESEMDRLKKFFGPKVFAAVYREEEFEKEFSRIAVARNPADERRKERDAKIEAEVIARATKGVMAAATSAAVTADRRRRKNLTRVEAEAETETTPA